MTFSGEVLDWWGKNIFSLEFRLILDRIRVFQLGKNVILITIDCLRADHVGCLGYHRDTTPNLDDLAEEGALFTEAIAQGDKTATSFPALLTSTYPLMFEGYKRISEPRKMIGEVFKEEGYLTGAIHPSPHLSKYFNYDRGFDYFEDFLLSKVPEKGTSTGGKIGEKILQKVKGWAEELHGRSRLLQRLRRTSFGSYLEKILGWENVPDADEINSVVAKWIEKNKDEDFFLWIHYMDVHMPLIPPLEFLEKFSQSPTRLDSTGLNEMMENGKLSEEEFEGWMNLYDAEIRHVDSAVGEIIEKLKEEGIWGETLTIVTADHGEEHLDHGGMGHVSGTLYEELIHIPLIIHKPGENYGSVNTQVELLDVFPTILEMLNFEQPEEFVGKSLVPLMEGKKEGKEAVFSEYAQSMGSNGIVEPHNKKTACRADGWKLIHYWNDEKNELYNLTTEPKENENVYGLEEEKTQELEKKIQKHISWEREVSSEIKKNHEKDKIKKKIRKSKLRE